MLQKIKSRARPDRAASRRTTWTKPTSSATASPSSITASCRARFAAEAQGVDPRPERARGQLLESRRMAECCALPDVRRDRHDHVFRMRRQRSGTTMALMEAARRRAVQSLSVRARRSTTCSCTTPAGPARRAAGPSAADSRHVREHQHAATWAIVERELRRFRRSPMLHRHVDGLSAACSWSCSATRSAATSST